MVFRKGFTLVELLVVIGIISVLAALLMPALAQSMVSARSVYCMNNLKQMGLSTQLYTNDNRGWTIPSSIYFTLKSPGRDNTIQFFYLLAYLDYLPHERYSTTSPHGIQFIADTVTDNGINYPRMSGRYYKPYNPLHFCPLSRTFSSGELYQAGQLSEFMYGSRGEYYNLSAGQIQGRSTGAIITSRIREIGPIFNTNLPASNFIMWGDSCIWYQGLVYCSRFNMASGSYSGWDPFISHTSEYPTFHMRHNRGGNAWFADGHVANVSYDTIVIEKLGILATYGPD